MDKGRVYKITIHDAYPVDRIKVSIVEFPIKNITDSNYILELYDNKTRRISKKVIEEVNAERAYIFDLSLVEQKVVEIIVIREQRLRNKIKETEKKLKQLKTIDIDKTVKHIGDF